MKIFEFREDGTYSRNKPLGNIYRFGYQGGSEGLASNGWVIRINAGSSYAGRCTPYDWKDIPETVRRIAYCIGQNSDGSWDWAVLARSLDDITPEERQREKDRRDAIVNSGLKRFLEAKAIITKVRALSGAEQQRLLRITLKWPYEAPCSTFYNTLETHFAEACSNDQQYLSDYVDTHIQVMNKALEIHAKYKPEVLPEGVEAPEGRQTISGEILSIKEKCGQFGYSLKTLIKLPNGTKVYGSLPKGAENMQRGDTIHFTATFSKSDDDPTFGFFKRPSNFGPGTIEEAKKKKAAVSTTKEGEVKWQL